MELNFNEVFSKIGETVSETHRTETLKWLNDRIIFQLQLICGLNKPFCSTENDKCVLKLKEFSDTYDMGVRSKWYVIEKSADDNLVFYTENNKKTQFTSMKIDELYNVSKILDCIAKIISYL